MIRWDKLSWVFLFSLFYSKFEKIAKVIDPGDWGLGVGGVHPTMDNKTTLGVGNGIFFNYI